MTDRPEYHHVRCRRCHLLRDVLVPDTDLCSLCVKEMVEHWKEFFPVPISLSVDVVERRRSIYYSESRDAWGVARSALLAVISMQRVVTVAARKGWTVSETVEKSKRLGDVLGLDILNGFLFLESSYDG